MSIILNNTFENMSESNDEACILRKIFDIIEAKKENKEIRKKSNNFFEKYDNINIKFENININENNPKNRYKTKLKKLIFKKNF